MRKRFIVLLALVLWLVGCQDGTSTPVNPTEQAATAEAVIAATRAVRTPEPTASASREPGQTPGPGVTVSAVAPSAGDRIAFWRDDSGVVDVYVLDPDTGELTNVSNNPRSHDFRPTWSPDGRLIAWVSDQKDNYDIFYTEVGNPDARPIALTVSMLPEIWPQWSPKENLIVGYIFRSTQYDVLRINVETHFRAYLTNNTPESSETHPIWSPDGEEIVFISDRDDNDELYLMNKDGWNLRRLTETPNASEWEPDWSPDGAQIAFVSDRDGNNELYLMRADGSDVRRLTVNEAADGIPTWSPDGRYLLFVSNRDGNAEIYRLEVACADTPAGCEGQAINLTNYEADDSLPDWSPDGRRIAFVSTRDGNEDIWLMSADGANPVNLTASAAQEWGPLWGPPLAAQP